LDTAHFENIIKFAKINRINNLSEEKSNELLEAFEKVELPDFCWNDGTIIPTNCPV